jgi:hypothetical protein
MVVALPCAALSLALLCVAILIALVVFRSRSIESFTPVVRLTAKEAAIAESRAEWDALRAKFGSDVEFRTVLEVDPPIVPPANPAAKSGTAGPAGPAGPLTPPAPVQSVAPKYDERPLTPPAAPTGTSGPRVELLVGDVVKARYPGALTAAGLDPWIRANASVRANATVRANASLSSR